MRHLYSVPFPDEMTAVRQGDQSGVQQNIAGAGLLGPSGGRDVQQVALDESDLQILGVWKFGDVLTPKIASDLESLAASNFGPVPFYSDGENEHDAYYEIKRDTVNTHPSGRGIAPFDFVISKVGTHGRHYRRVATNPDTNPDNPFSDSTGPLLGVDAKAGKTRWWTRSDGSEPASRTNTVASEHGEVALFNPEDSSFDDPQLVYELDFSREPAVDVTVWDDRNLPKYLNWPMENGSQVGDGSAVGDGTTVSASNRNTQWKHIFHSDYEKTGTLRLDNGRLRLRFNESNGLLTASKYGSQTGSVRTPPGSWNGVQIDHSDHVLYDARLEQINAVEATVNVEFENTSNGSIDALLCSVQRGRANALFTQPENAASTPQTLKDMISDIAATDGTDLNPRMTLVEKSSVED